MRSRRSPSQPYAERGVRLTAKLGYVASDHPDLEGVDVDFGTTPILFDRPGCPPMLAAENKTGELFVYDRNRLSDGPVQRLAIAGNASEHGLGSNGAGRRVVAVDEATGRILWSSGDTLPGAAFAPPVVIDGIVFVTAWDGLTHAELIAFAP